MLSSNLVELNNNIGNVLNIYHEIKSLEKCIEELDKLYNFI